MADKITISELDIDVDAIVAKQGALIDQIGKLRSAQSQLKKETGNLTDASEDQAKAYSIQDAQLKKLNQEYNRNKAVMAESTSGVKSLSKALDKENKSLEEAQKNNRELIKMRSKVNTTTKEGKAAIDQINKKIDSNNKYIKDNVAALEKQRLNIGNYASALDKVVPGLGAFSQNLVSTTSGALNAAKGLNVFKIALAATGIGAIVVALGSLVAMLTKTQGGIDLVTRITDQASAALDVIIDRFITFGGGVIKFFKGDFSGAVDEFKASFEGLGEELSSEIKKSGELADATAALEKRQIAFIVTNARLRSEMKDLNKIVEDTTVSLDDRIDAGRKAVEVEEKRLKLALSLAEEELRILKEKNALGTSTNDDYRREAELQAELYRLREEAAERLTTQQNKLNILEKQRIEHTQDEIIDITIKANGIKVESAKKANFEIKKLEEQTQEEIRKEKQLTTQVNQEEYEKQLASARSMADEIVNLSRQGAQSIIAFAKNNLESNRLLTDQAIEETNRRYDNQIEAAAGNSDAITQIELDRERELRKIKDLQAKREYEFAKKQKALAVAQSVIDTARATLKAFLSFPFPPLSTPQAIAAGIFGAAQTAAIAGQPLPRFAKGTKRVEGPGTDTSDSVPAFLSRNERVVDAATNRLIGFDMSNDQLATAALMYRGFSLSNPGMSDRAIVAAVKENTKAINRKPVPRTNIQVTDKYSVINHSKYLT